MDEETLYLKLGLMEKESKETKEALTEIKQAVAGLIQLQKPSTPVSNLSGEAQIIMESMKTFAEIYRTAKSDVREEDNLALQKLKMQLDLGGGSGGMNEEAIIAQFMQGLQTGQVQQPPQPQVPQGFHVIGEPIIEYEPATVHMPVVSPPLESPPEEIIEEIKEEPKKKLKKNEKNKA